MAKKNELSKLPFNNRLFYLDITTNLNLKNKIEFCVKQLGGTIEAFLDKKVRYVVTDKLQKDWPCSDKNKDKNEVVKNSEKLEMMGLTRGKMLAIKAPTTSAKTKDVLETAAKLNMKILNYRQILDFCKQYIKIPLDDVSCENSAIENLNSSTNNVKVKIKTLKGPFIKVEDSEKKFSPFFKEFETWPANNLDANPIIPNQIPKTFNTKLIPIQKKRERVYYCEICSKEFTKAADHVNTEQHKLYMNNLENYKELKSVIDSLPNWTSLNEQDIYEELNFTDEEEEEEFDETSSECFDEETTDSNIDYESKNNSDSHVPASYATPVKFFHLNNVFNTIASDEKD